MRKTNVFLYILVALTLCCVVLGIIGAIMTYNDVPMYTILKQLPNGYYNTETGHIYHDLEVSLIVSGTGLLALALIFLLLSRFVRIKNNNLFAIGAIPVYLGCMIMQIYAAVTYSSYENSPNYYPTFIKINTACLALMIVTAVILGVLAIATVVYVVITTISAKKYPVTPQTTVQHQSQQTSVSTNATFANTNEATPTLPRLSYEEGARQLLSFKSLYDCGILTEEEFIAQKQRIISSMD